MNGDGRQLVNHNCKPNDLLHVINRIAFLLLTPENVVNIENSLLECMQLIARSIDVDRVHIWHNEDINGTSYYVNQFRWKNENCRELMPALERYPYSEIPDWNKKFELDEYISGHVSSLASQERAILELQGVKSVLAIPLRLHKKFYGFFSFDDFICERSFSDDEISLLRSIGLMLVNALQIREAHERTLLLLDAIPLACRLWNKEYKIFECNEEAVKLFKLKNKQDYFEHFHDLSPKNQPDGVCSREKKLEMIKKAFTEGKCVFEWMHQLKDGTPLPCEITLVRVKYGDDYVVAGYTRDLRKHKQMMYEAEQMIQHVHKANEAKSNFLAGMSHEMRTPLNAIIGLSNLILETEGLDESTFDNIEKINNAGMMLLDTVNNILDISKIEAGKAELIPIEYSLAKLIHDTATQSAMHSGQKPIRFILNIPDTLPAMLIGDELRIKQVFNNILSNAFKYTKEGTVELGADCKRKGDTVWLRAYVKDTGVGISPENIKKLFLDYVQVDVRNNRAIMGIGLGLPLTKKVVELMGGTITVKSEHGKGSTFTVRIPQGFVSDESIGTDVVNNLINSRYINEKRKLPKLERIQLPYARVLMVDDVEINFDVAYGLMKPYKLQVDFASSGQQAIKAIREKKVFYSTVFMDHLMPEMDGIEAVRIIREEIGTDYAKNIPIIALTANAIVGNEEMFLSKGFQAFLSKPIQIESLDAVIRQWVRDEQQEKWLQLDGLNVTKGISYFNCDKEIYFNVLRSFAANLPSLLQKINIIDDLQKYADVVHGIKGSCGGVCAEWLEEQSENLEKAANSGNYNYVISYNTMFLEAAWDLLSKINKLFYQSEPSDKTKKEKVDTGILFNLLSACKKYDVDGAEAAVTELSYYEYETEPDTAFVSLIAEKMNLFDLEGIVDEISNLKEIRGMLK